MKEIQQGNLQELGESQLTVGLIVVLVSEYFVTFFTIVSDDDTSCLADFPDVFLSYL